MTHIEAKNNRVMWPERDTGRKAEWETGGWIIDCLWWKWRLWLPSKDTGRDGQSLLPVRHRSERHTHTHPGTDMHTYAHLHTCSHLLSALRDACWVHTHNKARISTIKLSAGKEAEPHSTISEQPTCSDKNWTKCTISMSGQNYLEVTTALLTHTTHWHQRSISLSCTVVTSVSSAPPMQLRTSQCYPTLQRKLIWVSQSAAECFIRHTVVCVHSALSPLFSPVYSLRQAPRTVCIFSLYTHYWSFWWVMPKPHWLKFVVYFSRPPELFHCNYGV